VQGKIVVIDDGPELGGYDGCEIDVAVGGQVCHGEGFVPKEAAVQRLDVFGRNQRNQGQQNDWEIHLSDFCFTESTKGCARPDFVCFVPKND
jgi:hypothetical protein